VPTKSADNVGHGERGTASIELVAAVPFLLLALAVAAQLALAGQALWSASVAARAGARAALVGADPKAAARQALPELMRAGATVAEDEGAVAVKVPVPTLLPDLPEFKVGARSGLGGDGE
jgi:Flp pilus assembly protein TadG